MTKEPQKVYESKQEVGKLMAKLNMEKRKIFYEALIKELITNYRSVAPYFLIFGLLIILGLNLFYLWKTPKQLNSLLKEPTVGTEWNKTMEQAENLPIKAELEGFLRQNGGSLILEDNNRLRAELTNQIIRVRKLVWENNRYAEGEAYLATLLYRQNSCSEALQHMKKAIQMDPGQKQFRKLGFLITKHCQ